MNRAVIYARYSSDMQREESVEAQIRACKYYAQQNGIDIVGIYADRAKSGMYHSEKREEFQALLNAAPRKEYDIVLVHKLNRFGRAGVKALNDRDYLERLGIEIISVTERLENTPEGRLMLYVITGMNEYYSRNLAGEVLKGLRENAYKGITTGGTPALGYNLSADKKLVINEQEASAVRLIFKMYTSGAGYGEIIDELNSRGFRTKRGAKFGKNSIYDILRNERYTGRFTYGKTKTVNGHRSQHKKEKEYISIEGGCPAIISADEWERVQRLMDVKKHDAASGKAKELYILSGKLFCGHCSARMVGNSRVSRGERYLYYDCNAKLRKKTCTKHAVKKNEIEQAVIQKLNQLAFSDDLIERFVDEAYKAQDNEMPDIGGKIADIDKKISNLVTAIENGADIVPIKQRMADLSAQKDALLSSNMPRGDFLTRDEIRSRFKKFLNIADLPPAQQKFIISEYVTRIEVFDYDGGGHFCRITLSNNTSVDTDVLGSSAPKGSICGCCFFPKSRGTSSRFHM